MAAHHAASEQLLREMPSQQLPDPPRHNHPRRPPAHKSVSLMHSSSGALALAAAQKHNQGHGVPASIQANPPSPLASKDRYQKDSSGESSNAERWFEASNNNVRNTSASLVDNDPPFLLRNSSSSEPSPDGQSRGRIRTLRPHPSSLLYRASVGHMPTGASSSEDYRSVIDDLTIENKKLKQKLRQYERHQRPELQSDKLVEIRTFNIPAGKKRELEEILRNFTMSLEDSHVDSSSGNGMAKVGPPVHDKKATPSHTSTRFGDSAYASMSASGNHSNAPSGQSTNYRKMPAAASAPGITHQQHKNIQSYLQEIPAGLLPKSGPIAMTERSKRKLVVRRLEQIFAGKAPAAGGHQHPEQQQEVARSAAQADRKDIGEGGNRALEEGSREAHIMEEMDESGKAEASPSNELQPVDVKPTASTDEAKDHTEQRPTRPLDLDPCRAQVPADNLKYIRHLGFSPRDVESAEPQTDGHGWIYLNLLINMAQLHTLNVTADFVRKSIADFSDKLELSHDGRKVRWKGGVDVTRTSSDSSPEDDHGHQGGSSYLKPKQRKKSRLTTAISSNDGSSEQVSKSNRNSWNNKLAYTPLFFRKPDSDADDVSDDNLSSWSFPRAGPLDDSPGFTSSGMRTGSSWQRRGDDGPITFYNKANFCTDLSGDPKGKDMHSDNLKYNRLATAPIGDADGSANSLSEESLEPRGFLSHPETTAADTMQVDSRTPDEVEMEMDQARNRPMEMSSSDESTIPIELEVSGVGGVIPTDNFSIRVKAKRMFEDGAVGSVDMRQQQRGKMYPSTIRDVLAESRGDTSRSLPTRAKAVSHEQIISERRKELPPSALPPPSFFPFGSPDTDGEEEYSESEANDDDLSNNADTLAAKHRPLPSAAPQLIDWPAYGSGEAVSSEEEEDDDDDESMDGGSDSSLDLLATARQLDPAAIHAKEREYDSQLADRLADEIPAGSSAATAGGGSGFNSPDTPPDVLAGNAVRRSSLKRARTSDNVAVLNEWSNKSPRLEA